MRALSDGDRMKAEEGKERFMGTFYKMTCRNKACGYSVQLREGPGMRMFSWIKDLEEDILSGKEEAFEEIKNLLKSGRGLGCVAKYICPTCCEWQTVNDPYDQEDCFLRSDEYMHTDYSIFR